MKKPRCPARLKGVARAEWKRIIALYQAEERFIDTTILTLHCEAFADYVAAREVVTAEGITSTTDKGNVIQHPAVGVMNRAWERTIKTAKEIGLTAAGRVKTRAAEPAANESKLKTKLRVIS